VKGQLYKDAYSPASLPPIDAVEVIVLGDSEESNIRDFIQDASLHNVTITGEVAGRIAANWRHLPPGEPDRCHVPAFALRFFDSSGMICEASICWECNTILGYTADERFSYDFSGESATAQQLLAELRRISGDM
jgi:hypothetical protein